MPLVEQRLRGLVYLTLELYRPLQKMMAGSIILFAPHVGAALRGRPWHKTSIDGQQQSGAPQKSDKIEHGIRTQQSEPVSQQNS